MVNPKVSIVVPAYNEESNIKCGVLDQVAAYLKKQKYSYEVLIVDDASKDKTADLIEEFISKRPNFRLIRNSHGGKAVTVMTGMLEAQGEVILFTDMDQATPLKELEKLLPKFEEGYDIVVGSRQGRKGAPLIRKLAALVFAILRTVFLGLNLKDTQCGFKAFTKKAVEKVFTEMLKERKKHQQQGAAVNAGWDTEFLFSAKKKGLKITEVPVEWHHVGTERVQLISDAVEAIVDMLRIRLNDFKGKYA